jgi:hypothetical protein
MLPCGRSPDFCTYETKCSIAPAVSLACTERRNLLWMLEVMHAGSMHGRRGTKESVVNAQIATRQMPLRTLTTWLH